MDLKAWGFPGLHLLEGEEVVSGLGRRTGLTTSAIQEKTLLLLTNRRVLSLERDGRRWHVAVAPLEEVEAIEMGSAGRNLTTLLIGAVGLTAGVVGWFLLPPSPTLLPWVAILLAGAGALLLLLALAFPEEAALVVRVGGSQMRLEVSDRAMAEQMVALVDRLFTLREARRQQGPVSNGLAPSGPAIQTSVELPSAAIAEDRGSPGAGDQAPAEQPTNPAAQAPGELPAVPIPEDQGPPDPRVPASAPLPAALRPEGQEPSGGGARFLDT